MRKKVVLFLFVCLAVGSFLAVPTEAQKKEIIELQANMRTLQEQVRDLQRSLAERTTVLKSLVEQTVDAVNRMNTTVADLERAVKEAQANSEARVDSLTTQVQALRDSLDEVSVRVAKLSGQLTETQSVLQSMDVRLSPQAPPLEATPGGPTPASAPATATSGIPSAETLYAAALRDFTTGKYDLARQQFGDYLKYYGETPLAGNAQFYIGETYYQQKDYRQAIAEYDRVLNNHPKSYKVAAAQLKKGYALMELNDREAGIRALRVLIREHPNSEEARLAQRRLERLGVARPGNQ
ncbi:MAG: tol-pal system protein YbgF [Acidobacteria bacterium]|nr:tol-pal system protein YbgF [Acidobacteriota bacterium]